MQIRYLNTLRCIATVCIVFLHTASATLCNSVNSAEDTMFFTFCKCSLQFAVPVFVLISGSLFLNPLKEVTYKSLFNKNIRRLVFALIVFSLPMCAIEQYMTGGSNFLYKWITGDSWDHMWYLYMLLSLYLLTPIIKPFVVQTDKKSLEIALIVLFCISSLLPMINNYIAPIHSYMTLPPYLFIYILGYYLAHKATASSNTSKLTLPLATLIICVVIIAAKCFYGIEEYGYGDPVVILMASSIFLLAKNYNICSKVADKVTPYCFCVYLIHPIFINVIFKVLKIDSAFATTLYGYLILGITFTLLATIGTAFLRFVPWLRKNVL